MAGVSFRNVSKAYERQAAVLRDVSLDIADGEFCVFVGPSGCGKSTLLRLVAGLEDITGGEILIGGRRVNDLAPSERNVAMVFQHYALYPHLSVAQNISFGLGLTGLSIPAIRQRVHDIAKLLSIDHLLDRRPGALSGGQRQRVAIGRALVREPGVFLFDEPLSNLDAALRTQMRVEMARLHRKYGRASTIYVTHDQVEAMTLADQIVLLNSGPDAAQGSVAQVGPPMHLYAEPSSLFVAGFIGSPRMNFLEARVEQRDTRGVTLRLRDGGALRAAVRADGLEADATVTLGVRPEHLSLGDAGTGANTLSGAVHWVERLGDATFAYVNSAAGKDLVVRLPGQHQLAAGDPVRVHVPAPSAHVFDARGRAMPRLTA